MGTAKWIYCPICKNKINKIEQDSKKLQTINVKKKIDVVDEKKAQELADNGTVVWKDNNDTVAKSDGTEVTEEIKEPDSVEDSKDKKNEGNKSSSDKKLDNRKKDDTRQTTKTDGATNNTQSETARVYLSKRETLKELDVNMFLMEYAAAAKELKELEEKNIIAQNQLKDTQSSYDRTKVEYERLEQELEDLNSKMDALRISGQEQAIRKQQLEGQINVLNEQILAGAQNEEHYKGRIQTIEAELSVRTDSKKKLLVNKKKKYLL